MMIGCERCDVHDSGKEGMCVCVRVLLPGVGLVVPPKVLVRAPAMAVVVVLSPTATIVAAATAEGSLFGLG